MSTCVHAHFGYGVDDPDDDDLAAAQIELNETVFGNIFWEVTKALRLGMEISHRKTDYLLVARQRRRPRALTSAMVVLSDRIPMSMIRA